MLARRDIQLTREGAFTENLQRRATVSQLKLHPNQQHNT